MYSKNEADISKQVSQIYYKSLHNKWTFPTSISDLREDVNGEPSYEYFLHNVNLMHNVLTRHVANKWKTFGGELSLFIDFTLTSC
jgi:hypothetical protein